MPKPEMLLDTEIAELIESKIVAETADSGWMLCLLLMRLTPTLKEVAAHLKMIDSAIAPDLAGHSVTEKLGSLRELRDISNSLDRLVALIGGERW